MVRFCGNPPKTAGYPLSPSSNDSVSTWIRASKNTSYALQERKQFLIKAYHIVKASQIDSTHVRNLTTIAFRNLRLGDITLFKKRTSEALALATRLNDSFAIGDGHWNYASYYNQLQVFDSAYHHFDTANKYFDKSGHISESAKMQYGMAFIKGRFKDYSGSEVLTFMAIKKFKQIEDYKFLYSSYDHLGTLQNDIYEYDKALYYYDRSLEYLDEFKNNQTQYQASLNNIGITYLKKEDYTQALQNFNTLLKNDRLKLNNKDYYARASGQPSLLQIVNERYPPCFKTTQRGLAN